MHDSGKVSLFFKEQRVKSEGEKCILFNFFKKVTHVIDIKMSFFKLVLNNSVIQLMPLPKITAITTVSQPTHLSEQNYHDLLFSFTL